MVTEPFTDISKLPHWLVSDIHGLIEAFFHGVLPPGRAMRFIGAPALIRTLRTTYAIVRWTDRWNQRWEYKQGQVTRVGESDPWKP